MTQCDMVLAYIRLHGSITALEADDALGVRRLAARIADLKDDGHDITSEMVTVINRRGDECRVARYSLAASLSATSTVTRTPDCGEALFDTQPFVDRW